MPCRVVLQSAALTVRIVACVHESALQNAGRSADGLDLARLGERVVGPIELVAHPCCRNQAVQDTDKPQVSHGLPPTCIATGNTASHDMTIPPKGTLMKHRLAAVGVTAAALIATAACSSAPATPPTSAATTAAATPT